MSRRIIFWQVLLLCIICVSTAWGAPRPNLWDKWTNFHALSVEQVDHSEWDRFLIRYIDRRDNINLIRYGDVTKTDQARVSQYVNALTKVGVSSLNRNEQRAYWINLYNALTVEVILDHYPVKSIRNINISGIFFIGPWDAKLISIDGEEITLNDIEHRILRPIWDDPRIHFALNCASIGCPNLQETAFTAENTETLLEKGAEEFLMHARGAEPSSSGSGNPYVKLSSIFDWYSYDFGATSNEVLEYIGRYNDSIKNVVTMARTEGKKPRATYHYDWALNDSQ